MNSHVYRLLTTTVAKKKAKKLIEIVNSMGFELKLSRAQELVAQMMGYDNWSELLNITRTSPERGLPDSLVPPKISKTRGRIQANLLADELDIDEWDAETVVRALCPTDGAIGQHWIEVDKFGLRLTAQDKIVFEEAMSLVRRFDTAARPFYALSGNSSSGLTHIRLQRVSESKRLLHKKRSTNVGDIVDWVSSSFPAENPLNGAQLVDVTAKAKAALEAFFALDHLILSLGKAPMLAPNNRTFLMLYRSQVSRGDKSHYTAICPEPWLHIGFDLPGFFLNPENEWTASRAIILQLALRREFIDSGWTDAGEDWLVTFRDGNSAKEELKVHASSGGAAFAWIAAARAALRIAKGQKSRSISLISARGPIGIVDKEQVLAEAMMHEVIRRNKLLNPEKLRIRGSRKAA